MQTTMTTLETSNPPDVSVRPTVTELLAPLNEIASRSHSLIVNHGARFEAGGQSHELPRYLFIGPKAVEDPIRIGIFAGIHGDEPEGVRAVVQFLQNINAKPELTEGYCLFVYPVCNPTGFENGTRHSYSGKDLNREFWKNSTEPEVKLLESELTSHMFHGIISLHTDDTSHGFYGFVNGSTLTEHLIKPALRAVEQFLPRNANAVIDGFRAHNGIIGEGYDGVPSAPPGIHPRPFDIILEAPKDAAEQKKEAAFVQALQTILNAYRPFIAYASNL